MTLVNKKAPMFQAKAVVNGNSIEDFNLKSLIGKYYIVLFFFPKDFTFVCPTELHAFQSKLEEFQKRNTVVLACSTDSEFSHYAWLNIPKNQGGIQGVTYTLISDLNKTISRAYGILDGETFDENNCEWVPTGDMVAFRALFLIDKNGVIQHELVNNMSLGRNVDEVLRTIDALQHVEKYGEVCPANWHKGEQAIQPTAESTANYLAHQN